MDMSRYQYLSSFYNSSAWRQKSLSGYCFKGIDRFFCLRTNEMPCCSANWDNIQICDVYRYRGIPDLYHDFLGNGIMIF